MTKLEYFKQWAARIHPEIPQDTINIIAGNVIVFRNDALQMAWLSFQHAFTIRPTEDGRMDKEEFSKDDPSTLVDRLRGLYLVPVPGAYKTAPIQHEAAREIERLREELSKYADEGSHVKIGILDWLEIKRGGERLCKAAESVLLCFDSSARYSVGFERACEDLRAALNKKPAEAG